MEKEISRLLIETVVKEGLHNIQDNPERGIRNLIDMAVQFSEGRFQKRFFSIAQYMLQNQNSAYYKLVRDIANNVNSKRILQFGLNLGYNACTMGAHTIRLKENELHCNIPWSMFIIIDCDTYENKQKEYHDLFEQGEKLGIYSWMISIRGDATKLIDLIKKFPNSAFFLFCNIDSLTSSFLDEIESIYNLMLVIQYEERLNSIYDTLRQEKLLYSVFSLYNEENARDILNGDLFYSIQEISPIFTILVPEYHCSNEVRQSTYERIKSIRNQQTFHTILFELYTDNRQIDSIISNDACSVYFNEEGDLCTKGNKLDCKYNNFFHNRLQEILMSGCAK